MTKMAVQFLLGPGPPCVKAVIPFPVNEKNDRTYLIGIVPKLSELV